MRIVLTGATGFIGRALVPHLVRAGHACLVLTRHPRPDLPAIQYRKYHLPSRDWYSVINGADAVINLAGEPVARKRWTRAQKERIRHSRVETTTAVVAAIAAATRRPRVLINASATGYYGDRSDEVLTESSSPGDDFLAEVAVAWEVAALRAQQDGVRVVCLRLGIVLGPDGGVLARILPLFRHGLGGRLGTGRQWMSWIHRDDVIGVIDRALGDTVLCGPLNTVSSHPVTNAEFTATMGKVLHRPTWVTIPAVVLRAILGEQATLPLTSARVMPRALVHRGHQFGYPHLETALRTILTH